MAEEGRVAAAPVRKLKTFLRHAYENVPYYHESFKKNGFHPSSFSGLGDLQKIPVLQRSELRLKLNELVAENAKKSNLISSKTSGTTATPVNFYRSKIDITWDMAAWLRGLGWAGFESGAKLVYIRLFEPNDSLASVRSRLERRVKRWRLLGGYDFSEKSMASFCSKNRNFKPDYVLGGAGPTNIFAVFLLENTQFKMRPKAVVTYGETLLPHYRRTIEEAFKCKVFDWYGSTEIAHIASQCGHHKGLHVADENVFLEIEKDGESAAPGEEGKILLTNMNSFAMPLIRYDIGDRGKMLADDCPCGRKLSLVTPVGRTCEYFVHSDGSFTFFRDLQTVLGDLPIEDFQIVQSSYDEIVIRIVKRADYTNIHTDFILKHVRLLVSDKVKVRVELADSVPLIGFGKVPHYVSKIPTKYT